jgi:hypothetical protein
LKSSENLGLEEPLGGAWARDLGRVWVAPPAAGMVPGLGLAAELHCEAGAAAGLECCPPLGPAPTSAQGIWSTPGFY